MAVLAWIEAFSVGNELLDADHRILIDLVNQLDDAVETGQSRDVVGSVLNVLTEYVQHHFRREEAMLAKSGFPERDAHATQHRALEQQVRDIRQRWMAGDRTVLQEDVLAFLRKWLTDHILVSDKSYRAWVGNASARASRGEGHASS
ncbi:MAG: bacteriohemerythrin [Solirubrobacterales bacterium]